MSDSLYEPHIMENPELPFILHRDSRLSTVNVTYNWHINIELLYCTDGEGYVTVDDKDIPFCRGSVVVVNSNRLHRVCSEGSVRYNVLIIDHRFCAENGVPTDETLFEDCIRDAELCHDFDRVIKCYGLQGKIRTAAVRHAVLGLLIRLYRDHFVAEDAAQQSSVTVERIKSVVRYIRQHVADELTLDEIAASAGVSKYHLAREFKRFSGQTVFEHINAIRCKEAKRLIESGMSVSAAALSCGFENMSYFSRTYKKYTGTLPSSVRGRGRKNGAAGE